MVMRVVHTKMLVSLQNAPAAARVPAVRLRRDPRGAGTFEDSPALLDFSTQHIALNVRSLQLVKCGVQVLQRLGISARIP